MISALAFILLGEIVESDVVESVVVDCEEDDDLSEERDSEPRVKDCVWCSYTRDCS